MTPQATAATPQVALPKIDRIHHVAYRCRDARETVEWYGRMLNMDFVLAIAEDQVPSTREPDPYMHIFLDAGGGNVLAFFELPTQPQMGRDPNTPSWVQHIAFRVRDRDTLLAYKAHLQANGVDVLGTTDHGAFHSIYFFDPNGHRLELACPDPEEAQMLQRMDAVKWQMLHDWSATKRAPHHADFLHRREFSRAGAAAAAATDNGHGVGGMSAAGDAPFEPGQIDASHDPQRRSWVASAQDAETDFPVQNLPYARWRRAASAEAWRIGVAIGDQVLDLAAAALLPGLWTVDEQRAMQPLAAGDLNAFMAAGPADWHRVRQALSRLLSADSPAQAQAQLAACLWPQAQAEYTLPCQIGDYTDFYTGIHHATTVGRLFRPDNPLLPNYRWVPIGYHGRSSSIQVSGHGVHRPLGQIKGPSDASGDQPQFGPCQRLDYELELGVYIGAGNAAGQRIGLDAAEAQIFGLTLLNDWSARDVQAWEYQPLGPFLAKNFATTVSPWIVTAAALAPYRRPFERPAGDPQPLPYLDGDFNRRLGAFDIALEVWLQPAGATQAQRLSQSHYAQAAYWTPAQLVTHHSVGGCNLRPGDLLGTGTLSGPAADQGGSLLELTQGGQQPLQLACGQTRRFLQDGDRVTLRARAQAQRSGAQPGGPRIGFGDCSATVWPALP